MGEAAFDSVFAAAVSVLAGAASFCCEASEEVVPFDSALLPPGFADEYRSEYQPPPLRMKPVPALISRCALDLPHLGQTSTGGSVIRWTSSHWLPQAEHPYS